MRGSRTKEIVLLKDLIIPAGTRFIKGPTESIHPVDSVETVQGIGKDFAFSIVVSASDAVDNASEYFTDIK